MATEPLVKPYDGCSCADWPEQIVKVNGPIVNQTIRSGGLWQYDGIPFRFCPWCGKQLPLSETGE
jgi:hypothetical protein